MAVLATAFAAPGCGGASSRGASSVSVSAAPPEITAMPVWIDTSNLSKSDPVTEGALGAVKAALAGAGYRVVDNSRDAELFAGLVLKKEREESIFKVQVNGRERVTYKVKLTVGFVDHNEKVIDKASGDYSTSDGEADAGAVSEIINQLSGSAALMAYAKSSKAERETRVAKQAEEEHTRAVARAASDAKDRAVGTVNQAIRLRNEIFSIAHKAEEPIPEDKIKALADAVDELEGSAPNAASQFAHSLKTAKIENAWWKPEAERSKVIAKVVGGDVVASGESNGKKLDVALNAKAGHCYTVFMRYKTVTGREEVKEKEWSAQGGNTPLQRYGVWSGEKPTFQIEGTCVTKDVSVKLNADLVFAGTKNALQYVVLDSTKSKFPLYVATYMHVFVHDPCDTEAWEAMWLDPIPGAIVYIGAEPVLVSSPERAGQLWITYRNATMREGRSQKNNLTQAPPKAIKFHTQYSFPRCSKDHGETPETQRFAACHKQIDKKYDAQWDAAERAKENAVTIGGVRAAQAQLDRIRDADDRDRENICGPIEKKLEKKWEATFNKIVDTYTDKPYESPIDRAGELWAQDYEWHKEWR